MAGWGAGPTTVRYAATPVDPGLTAAGRTGPASNRVNPGARRARKRLAILQRHPLVVPQHVRAPASPSWGDERPGNPGPPASNDGPARW